MRTAELAQPRCLAPTGTLSARDLDFISLLNAYRSHGGLACLHHPPDRAGRAAPVNDRIVQALMDAGQLFGFNWHHAVWVPRFQLEEPGSGAAPGPRRVVAELGPAFDGWAVADWFVRNHIALDGRSPIDCVQSRLTDVLQAARVDRCGAMS